MAKIKRYLIPANGEVKPIKDALNLLLKLCEELEAPNAILLIPTKRNIQGTTLERALGQKEAKALLKDKSLELLSGVNLRLETQRTFQYKGTSEIIIGVYVNNKMLNQIDNAKNAKAVIIVPWVMDDVKEWIRTWNPQVIGGQKNPLKY